MNKMGYQNQNNQKYLGYNASSKKLSENIKLYFQVFPNFWKKIKNLKIKDIFNFNKTVDKKKYVKFRIWDNPFKSYLISQLSPYSILIEKQPFEEALKVAIRYFKVRKRQNLIWKKIYYFKPNKNTDANVDGYKFFYHEDNATFMEYLIDQNRESGHFDYSIKNKQGNIYINLLHELYSSPITLKDMKKKLQSFNIKSSNSLTDKIFIEKRKWLKKESKSINLKRDGKVSITISKDMLKAYITKTRHQGQGREVDIKDVKKIIKKHKIIYGINHKKIQSFVKDLVYDEPVLIADVEPINNKYGSLYEEVYRSSPSTINTPYQKKEDLFFLIEKEEIILKRKIPKNKNPRYYSVFGEVFDPHKLKWNSIKNGKNTYFDDEGNLRSRIEGTLVRKDNVFNVYEVLSLETINAKVGNIVHHGSVVVEKDIEDGVSVSVSGAIYVKGYVGASQIEAGDNIVISQGVNGSYKATLRSKEGSIFAKYIRNASVYCREKLIVENFLNSCKAWVGDSILLVQPKSTVLGGEFYTYKQLTAYNIGSIYGWKTYINIGTSVKIVQEIEKLENQIYQLKKDAEKLKNDFKIAKQNQSDWQEDLKNDILKNKKLFKETRDKLERIEKEKSIIYEKAKLTAYNNIYPGVTIQMGNSIWKNKYKRSNVSFTLKVKEEKKNIVMKKI